MTQVPSHAAPETGDAARRIPISEIDEGILTRDRTGLDAEPLDELLLSIATHGLRQPVEVFPLADHPPLAARARPGTVWGLVSGFRRLACFRARLAAGDAACATIPAFVRRPDSLAAALTEMVEENEIRADLSPFERGRICVAARDAGVFASLDEAVETLYASTSRTRRQRIRQLAFLAEEMDGQLTAPERLTQAQALRLAEALRRGMGDAIRTALGEARLRDPAAEWQLILPAILDSEATLRDMREPTIDGRPRRVASPRPGIVIRRETTRAGYALHFTGKLVDSELMDLVFAELDRMFGRP